MVLPVPPPLSLSPSLRLLPFCSHKHLPIPPIPFNDHLFACLLESSHLSRLPSRCILALQLVCRSPSSGFLVLYETRSRRCKHSSHHGSTGNYSLVKAKKGRYERESRSFRQMRSRKGATSYEVGTGSVCLFGIVWEVKSPTTTGRGGGWGMDGGRFGDQRRQLPLGLGWSRARFVCERQPKDPAGRSSIVYKCT